MMMMMIMMMMMMMMTHQHCGDQTWLGWSRAEMGSLADLPGLDPLPDDDADDNIFYHHHIRQCHHQSHHNLPHHHRHHHHRHHHHQHQCLATSLQFKLPMVQEKLKLGRFKGLASLSSGQKVFHWKKEIICLKYLKKLIQRQLINNLIQHNNHNYKTTQKT